MSAQTKEPIVVKEDRMVSDLNEPKFEVEEIITAEEERRIVRKIDLHLLPLLFSSYMLQYLDKTTLGYAAILGLIKDNHLTGDRYSWVSSAFYFGYLVASYPAAIGLVKFPLGKYMAATVMIWSIMLAVHGAVSNFIPLTVLRTLLGVFESAISPGFTMLTAIWYKPEEHVTRASIWYAGNATGAIFGGLLAYAMGHIRNGISPWRWVFIIFGIISFAWGVLLYFSLPDSPLTARWLTAEERAYANRRPQAAQKSFKTTKWEKDQVIEALIDPKTWLLTFYIVLISLPNGGVTNFNSIVIKGFGFDTFHTLLYGIVAPAINLFLLLVNGYLSHKFRKIRCFLIMWSCALGLIGVLLVTQLPTSMKWGRLVGIWIFACYATGFPIGLSLIASNFAGYTKKTTVGAIFFIGYCAGNIGGPLLFKAKEAPKYQSGFIAILVCLVLGIVDIFALYLYMAWENKRRDRKQGVIIEAEPKVKVPVMVSNDVLSGAIVDVTDWQNPRFRYYL